jgi:hypothetical protein
MNKMIYLDKSRYQREAKLDMTAFMHTTYKRIVNFTDKNESPPRIYNVYN